jgi:hypothetical protein
MGDDLCGPLGFVVDHSREYSGIQRCVGACGLYYLSDCVEKQLTLTFPRVRCLPVGFPSVYPGCSGSILIDLVGS